MNKYVIMSLLVLYLVLVTYIVDVSTTYATTESLNQALEAPANFGLVSAFTMLKTMFGIITFQITGFPAILNIICFYIPGLIFFFYLIDTIRG